jgi:6-phosphogluconolactonase
MQNTGKPALYVSVGRELTHYDVDIDNAALTRRSRLTLPSKLQYAWPHPSAPCLYAACSSGGPGIGGDAHVLLALRVDPATGSLSAPHAPVQAPSRPIHVTVDLKGGHVLTAYNHPSSVTVHRIEGEGAIGAEVKQRTELDTGIYAHQVKVSPSGQTVIVVARGNDATATAGEDPGALKVFTLNAGQLTPLTSVAPNGGYGFGPRHLDFHPTKPWVYVSLERQNTMQMYRMTGDSLEAEPAYTKETLADTAGMRPRQRSGTIHVHPNGRYVYVANRASGTTMRGDKEVYVGGENSIAVFEIDQASGEPRVMQQEDTRGIVPRTFALESSGRVLVAANSVPILAAEGGEMRIISPGLSVFRVGEDGKLDYERSYDIDVGKETMFWMGIVG